MSQTEQAAHPHQQAIEDYAEDLFQSEIEYQQTWNPERYARFLQDNPNGLVEYKAKLLDDAGTLADLMLLPAAYAHKLSQGALHPSNKRTRRMFTAITGIKLPNTVKGTEEALVPTLYGEELRAFREKQAAEREEESRRRDEAEALKTKEVREKLEASVRKDEHINGEELLGLCRFHGIEVHPRTAGFWKSRIVAINSDSGKMNAKRGQSTDATSAYRAYRELRKRLTESVLT